MGNTHRKQFSSQQPRLTGLPEIVIIKILSYLDLKCLASIAGTCKTLKDLAYSARLWRQGAVELPMMCALSGLRSETLTERAITTLKITDAFQQRDFLFKERRMLVTPDHQKLRKKYKGVSHFHVDNMTWFQNSMTELLISEAPFRDQLPIHIPIESWINFTSLRCLVMIYTLDIQAYNPKMVSHLGEAISKLVNLEKLVFIISIGDMNLTGLNDHSHEALTDLEIVNQMFNPMPKLRDLAVGKSYWDQYGNVPVYVAHHELQLRTCAPNLERLSIPEGWLGSQAAHIPMHLPSLKHLSIGKARIDCLHQADPGHEIRLQSLLENAQSLRSLELGEIEMIERCDTHLVPERVQALRLSGLFGRAGIAVKMNIRNIIQKALNSLCVLELDVLFFMQVTMRHQLEVEIVTNLCDTVRSLTKLQILILSRYTNLKMPEPFHDCIFGNVPDLFSLIGVDFSSTAESYVPSKLRFITESTEKGQRLLERSAHSPDEWEAVKKYSSTWCIAHGSAYFYPQCISETAEMAEHYMQRETLQRDIFFRKCFTNLPNKRYTPCFNLNILSRRFL